LNATALKKILHPVYAAKHPEAKEFVAGTGTK
jgi:hypothetical protein